MRQEIRGLQGELEIARKEASEALAEVQRTRTSLAQQTVGAGVGAGEAAAVAGVAAVEAGGDSGAAGVVVVEQVEVAAAPAPKPALDQELAGYQNALDSWRKDDFAACIERFTAFLQAYPTSGYADDAAYWLADCTYRNEEYKRAVIRFADVVRVYPDSPKAPDALYRQGESLLKLGPRFQEAARTVFKRLQRDYPDSERSVEAARQLDRLKPAT
jgi:tol-pal system protein YbgF